MEMALLYVCIKPMPALSSRAELGLVDKFRIFCVNFCTGSTSSIRVQKCAIFDECFHHKAEIAVRQVIDMHTDAPLE